MRRRPESRHRRSNRPPREVFCPAERPRGTFAAEGVVFSPTEPFVLSGDACGSTFLWSQGQRVGRPMPRRNQTLTGRSPNAPPPSVSAASPLTSSGPTSGGRAKVGHRGHCRFRGSRNRTLGQGAGGAQGDSPGGSLACEVSRARTATPSIPPLVHSIHWRCGHSRRGRAHPLSCPTIPTTVIRLPN